MIYGHFLNHARRARIGREHDLLVAGQPGLDQLHPLRQVAGRGLDERHDALQVFFAHRVIALLEGVHLAEHPVVARRLGKGRRLAGQSALA